LASTPSAPSENGPGCPGVGRLPDPAAGEAGVHDIRVGRVDLDGEAAAGDVDRPYVEPGIAAGRNRIRVNLDRDVLHPAVDDAGVGGAGHGQGGAGGGGVASDLDGGQAMGGLTLGGRAVLLEFLLQGSLFSHGLLPLSWFHRSKPVGRAYPVQNKF